MPLIPAADDGAPAPAEAPSEAPLPPPAPADRSALWIGLAMYAIPAVCVTVLAAVGAISGEMAIGIIVGVGVRDAGGLVAKGRR